MWDSPEAQWQKRYGTIAKVVALIVEHWEYEVHYDIQYRYDLAGAYGKMLTHLDMIADLLHETNGRS